MASPVPRPAMRAPVSIVAARFEDLVAVGLRQLIDEDEHLDLLEHQIDTGEIERVLEERRPQVFQLHQTFPETRIVVLANRPTAAECNQMLSFGATACLSKETEARDVINAIHLASRGMHVLPRSAAAGGGAESLNLEGSDLLTPREADVLALLQEGATNAQIAHALSIGVETVRTHARNIYRKLGVASRRELARLGRPDPVVVDAPGEGERSSG